MAPFDKVMNDYQTEWRQNNVASQEWGYQNGRRYPWVLPQELWEEGLWAGIRSGSDNSLPAYLERAGVQKHQGVHNLKSSWTMCANLYFPFGASAEGRELFAMFLKRHVAEEIDSLEAIELEHAESGELSPLQLLGELGGMRGANQTSPDLGLLMNGGRGLALVENKFTEHSFYECSAWRHKGSSRRPGNPDPDRCLNPLAVVEDPLNQCHQAAWGRRYWEPGGCRRPRGSDQSSTLPRSHTWLPVIPSAGPGRGHCKNRAVRAGRVGSSGRREKQHLGQ